jgi:tetratricopeptide (TPR) repeat protein
VSANTDPDARILFYSKKLSADPRLYPASAALGRAYLDKARDTYDPDFLEEARAALARSMSIQPNIQAFKTMAALCNFAHRFEDALQWGKRAADLSPNDAEITALRVEAYLGLGRYGEARSLLPIPGIKPSDFHIAAALASWMTTQGCYTEAAGTFEEAANIARAEGQTDLVVWAEVSAAGVHLDARRPGLARIHLRVAAALDPGNKMLRLHQGEFLEVEKRLEEALIVYERLAEEQPDPDVHRRASAAARQLGREKKAQLHFEMAEKGFRRALVAGERYTLGGLVRLYCDAGVHLDRALALARRNLKYTRGTEAEAALECVLSKQQDRSGAKAL